VKKQKSSRLRKIKKTLLNQLRKMKRMKRVTLANTLHILLLSKIKIQNSTSSYKRMTKNFSILMSLMNLAMRMRRKMRRELSMNFPTN